MVAEEQLRQAIGRAVRDGRAPCKELLALARRTGTPPGEIGRLCDEMHVRISECQLGCFR